MLRANSLRLASKKVYVLGGCITPFIGKGNSKFIDKRHKDFGSKKNPTLEDTITAAVKGTLKQTQLEGKEELIDTLCLGNFAGELYNNQGHLGAALAGALVYGAAPGSPNPFLFKPSLRVEAACASGGIAVREVWQSIKAGEAEIGLAVGAEVQTTVKARQGADYLARAAHYATQRSLDDFMFPCLFARRMKACVESGKYTMNDIATVAVKAYQNANKNPLAHMHEVKLSLEAASDPSREFLGNEAYKPFLRLSDCSQVSDGGAGVVLASEEGLRRLGLSVKDERLVEVKSMALVTGNLYDPCESQRTHMPTSAAAARRALELAGIKASDLQVAEVHDCFTPTELFMYEAIGLCEEDKGAAFLHSGATSLEGSVPVNTGGGLVAFGHPVGATGVKQIVEVYRQMKGLCGDYQIARRPQRGITVNMGGDDKTAVSTVLENIQ